MFVFTARDFEGRLDRLVDVGRAVRVGIRVREFLHGAHDVRDALQAVARALHRLRQLAQQIVGLHFGGHFVAALAIDAIGGDDVGEIVDRFAQERHVVGDELHGRVDLVCHAGSESSHGLELLRHPQLECEAVALLFPAFDAILQLLLDAGIFDALRDVGRDADEVLGLAVGDP